MSQCQTSPTATEFTTITSDSESTSTSESLSTVSASLTTIEQTVCATSTLSGSAVTTSCSTTDVVSTLTPEQTITNQVPIVVTVPVTLTSATSTLFTTVCSSISTSDSESSSTFSTSSTTSAGDSSSSTTLSSSSPSSALSTSLSVLTSASTLPGGSVIIVTSTSTAVITPTASVTLAPGSDGSSSNSSTNVGAIVGGVVGGVAGVVVIVLLLWYIAKRRRENRDDDFDDLEFPPLPVKLRKAHEKNIALDSLTDDAAPRPFDPYGYGAVGGSAPAPSGMLSTSTAAPPPTTTVRRRNPTSAEGVGYLPASTSPLATSQGHMVSNPNSSEGYGYDYGYATAAAPARTPPAQVSEGSVYSANTTANALTSPSDHGVPHRPLQVMNPSPGATPVPVSVGDMKDPMVYLTAEHGMEVRGGGFPPGQGAYAGPSGAGAAASQGSPSAPYVHQDAGVLPASVAATPGPHTSASSQRPAGQDDSDAPPPAYSA